MHNHPLPRLDQISPELRQTLVGFCRLRAGDVWVDPVGHHRVMCGDAASDVDASTLMTGTQGALAIQDPPYNFIAFERRSTDDFTAWCGRWVAHTFRALAENAALYVWIGADQTSDFEPLPEFMMMMRGTGFHTRSFITVRNQRGFGTQKNWMAVRQELLYYTKGSPAFDVQAEYTDIPKILRGYYKDVAGKRTENGERGRSPNIRAGNVWVDVQQVFYRMEENVSGCYAQKPLLAYERIINASSRQGDVVLDWFGHSGTSLLAAERLSRRCFTMDTDPICCEIAIRRLERFRSLGRTGWQGGHAFEDEEGRDPRLASALQAAGAKEPAQTDQPGDLFSLAE
jgi:site-specific DNA-methyltransferase (adenine-specific)